MVNQTLHEILHVIGQRLLNPCMIVLIVLIGVTIMQIGDFVIEYIFERRKMKEDVPGLLKRLNKSEDKAGALRLVSESKLLKRQKKLALKLSEAEGAEENSLAAFARELLSEEDARYQKTLTPTDLIAKLGPMLGLLGTLIPLGPGIVALGQGDIQTLSTSIGVGFDTTIIGVLVAAICFSISYVRRQWYERYAGTNEAVAESLLDKMAGRAEASEGGAAEKGRTAAPVVVKQGFVTEEA